MWGLDVAKVRGPRYLAVAGAIARAIDSGALPPGAQLPTQRDLAEQLGVTVGTVSRAYALARKRRLIVGEVGRGTFVQGISPVERNTRYIPAQAETGIDLGCFRSPVEGLSQSIVRCLDEVGERAALLPLHKYPPAAGTLSHRLAGTAWIGRSGFNVPAERVLITNGAQQAIAVCLATLANHGDTILTEELTYSGVKAIAAHLGLRLRAVAMDRHGMLPDALDRAAAESGARVVYLQPTVHNPSCASIPAARRKRIAEIARKRDLLVIEDDAAASALADRPEPLSALVPDRSCYITSLSKSVSPTLRIGYIAAADRLLGALTYTVHTLSLGTSPIKAEVAALLIGKGTAQDIAQSYVRTLARELDAVRDALAGRDTIVHAGAFFFWLGLPEGWNAEAFVLAAKQRGVTLPAEDSFLVSRVAMPAGVRVSIHPSSQAGALRKGLAVVDEVLGARPQSARTVV
jgi:DNA-binding transcriptional MocR family regulator